MTCVGHFLAGPIIESKGMRVDEKGKKRQQKVKMYKIRRYFEKGESLIKREEPCGCTHLSINAL